MKKAKLKLPYNCAELEILNFETCDIVTASGNTEPPEDIGGSGGDNYGWT